MSAKFQLSISDSWADRPPLHPTDPLEYPVTGIFLFLGKGNGSMARVLKITCGLMGVLLLVVVGVMGAGRTTPEQPILIKTYWDGQYIVDLVYLEAQKHFELRQFSENRVVNWSDDGRWVYFFKNDLSDSPIGGQAILVRSRLNGDDEQVITRSFTENAIIWTPDRRWIVSLYDTPQGLFWRRVRPDGSDPVLLTQNLDEPLRAVEFPALYFSPDGLWMYFDTALENIYRVNLEAATLENVTNGTDRWMRLNEFQLDGDTIFVEHEEGLGQIDLDGTLLMSFGAKTPIALLPKNRLVILKDTYPPYYVSGVSLNTGEVLWEIEEMISDWAVTPDEEWLIFFLDDVRDRQFRVMRWDGTDIRNIAPSYFIIYSIGAGPDSQCFLYTSEPKEGDFEVTRISITNWQTDVMWRGDNTFASYLTKPKTGEPDNLILLTSNGRDLIFYETGCTSNGLTQVYQLEGQNIHSFYLGPQISLSWQPPILAAVALTLIGTPLVLSHLRRQHPR